MADPARPLSITEGDHICSFFDDPREGLEVALQFLSDGLDSGRQCVWVLEDPKAPCVEEALALAGPRVALAMERKQFVIRSAEEVYLHAGIVTPELLLDAGRQVLSQARDVGFSGLQIASDMSWALRSPFWLPQLIEFEAKANLWVDRYPLVVLCQYSRRRFPEETLLDLLRAHPRLIMAGRLLVNPHFLPPNILLQRDKRDTFAWYMENLQDPDAWARHRGDRTMRQSSQSPADRRSTPLLHVGSLAEHPLIRPIGSPDDALKFLGRDAPSSCNASHRHRVEYGARRWQVYCFGELRVVRGDGAVVDWSTGRVAALKAKTLFAYLLHCGESGARAEELADMLWPEQEDLQKAMGRLYHTVHGLRLALEPTLGTGDPSRFIVSEGRRYYLALPEGSWLDVTLFETLCYRGLKLAESRALDDAQACFLAAESLYTGDFLADVPSLYADNVDRDWCWSRRYWLREMYIKLMLCLADIFLSRGAVNESLSYWQRALDLDPLREEAHQGLLRTFHRAGRRDALVRQFSLCEKQMRSQGVGPPSPQLVRTYRELLASLSQQPDQQRTEQSWRQPP